MAEQLIAIAIRNKLKHRGDYFCWRVMVYFRTMLLMAKSEKKKIETEQINIRLSEQILNRLDRIGEPLGIRRSQLIHQAVVEFILRIEQQQPTRDHPRR